MTRLACKSTIMVLAVFVVGCSVAKEPVEREKLPRPVTTLVLKQINPQRATQLTGSVASWKTEQIGFQVPGRVDSVLEPGRDIRGRTVDENRRVITQGTVIAELEKDRYELNLAVAEAQKETAIAKVQAKASELEQVIPQQIKAAQASVTLTLQEFDRVDQLFKRKVATRAEHDKAQANLDTAQAELDQVKATGKVTKAERNSLIAQAKEAAVTVEGAQKDLDDTRLLSPFHGQIAEVHEIPGGYVQAGEPVVTVQMMDPIMVEVAVSAKTDARLNYNDVVQVYLPESETPVQAIVYEKATIADPATRTFTVTLLVRNEKIEVGLPKDEAGKDALRIRAVWRVFTEKHDRTPPYYVNIDSLYEDGDGFFVWKVENWTVENIRRPADSRIRLRKVRVTPGEKRIPFLQVAIMRELTDYGELNTEQDLFAGIFFTRDGRNLDKSDVVSSVQDGDVVFYVRQRWRLRPGDIVRVDLQGETLEPGFYVPADVILEKSGKNFVFTVDLATNADRARQVEVHVFETLGTLHRIEAAGDKPLSDEMRIVADGALFLTDGEKIMVVDKVEQNR